MQNDEHNSDDTIRPTRSNRQGSSSKVQLSENTTRRLKNLAQWRIDPALIKFRGDAPKFEGGYAIVSRALQLSSLSDDTGSQAVGSGGGILSSSNRTNAVDNRDLREAESSGQKRNRRDEVVAEGEAHELDSETSGQWKAVAVKKMKMRTPDEVVQTLGLTLREAEFLVKLAHENIIKLEGFVEDVSKEMVWLIFPWEDHGTLKEFVALHDWEIPERISLIYDVTRGVEYLHSSEPPIIHGDLKSINILVNSECRAVITDFGSARHPVIKSPSQEKRQAIQEYQPSPTLEATHGPSTNTITLTCNQYTLRWAAPELLADDDADLASDIWAVGCVAYEVMTNSIPFQDVRDVTVIVRVVRGDLPSISSDARMLLIQALCSLVGQCWSIDPSKRPTAGDCQKAINWMPMIIPNLDRTVDGANFVDRSPELLEKLGHMYQSQGNYSTASEYYVKALDVYTNIADMKGEARTLSQLAQVYRFQNQYHQSITSYSKALQIFTDIGDRPGRADALWGLAEVHRFRYEWSEAISFYSECLQIRTDIGDLQGQASTLNGLAEVHRRRNEYSQAIKYYSECLRIRTDIGHKRGRADALWGLASVYRCQNKYSQAVALYSECLQLQTDIGDQRGKACALRGLAEVHRLRSEYTQAMRLFSEALEISTDIGDRYMEAFTLQCMADGHRDQGDHTTAIHHYEQAAEIYKQIGQLSDGAIVLMRAAGVRWLMKQESHDIFLGHLEMMRH